MSLKVASINDLSQDAVDQAYAEFSQLVAERHPEISLSRGVFDDLVAYFAGGVSGAVNQTEVNRVLESRSLLAISENPELADPELVDHVLSNFRVERLPGAFATGLVVVVVADDLTTVVPADLVFTASGASFLPDDVYTARPTGSILNADTDRLLQAMGDGRFSFSFPATAVKEGPDGNIKRGTVMVPTSPPGNFVTAYAGTDFSGGLAEELNAALIQRLQEGIAAKVMQGRTNIVALLKEEPAFEAIGACSIIGYGNPEMLRDQHGIFPISSGGRIDLYVRATAETQTVTLSKTATFMGISGAGGIWQFSIAATEAPGFYEVVQILKPDEAPDAVSGFEITLDQRGWDIGDEQYRPDIVNAAEAAYSRYQTAVIRFVDNETPVSGLVVGSSTALYTVAVRRIPLISELQDYCGGSGVRNLASDILVKAPIPCFLTINFTIQQNAGDTAPDLDTIKSQLVAEANDLGFPGRLTTAWVADIVHNYLLASQSVRNIELRGRIRLPSGVEKYISADDVLTIPDDPANMATGRTVGFFLDAASIGASVVTEDAGVVN